MKHIVIAALLLSCVAWFPGKRLKNRIQERRAAAGSCATC